MEPTAKQRSIAGNLMSLIENDKSKARVNSATGDIGDNQTLLDAKAKQLEERAAKAQKEKSKREAGIADLAAYLRCTSAEACSCERSPCVRRLSYCKSCHLQGFHPLQKKRCGKKRCKDFTQSGGEVLDMSPEGLPMTVKVGGEHAVPPPPPLEPAAGPAGSE